MALHERIIASSESLGAVCYDHAMVLVAARWSSACSRLPLRACRMCALAVVFLAVMQTVLWCQIPASEALNPGDRAAYHEELNQLDRMLQTAGDKCTVMLERARIHARRHQWQSAFDALEQLVAMNVGLDPSRENVFSRLRGTAEFERLLRQVKEATPPVSNARLAFSIGDSILFPAGISYSPRQRVFVLGSGLAHRIFQCTSSGTCRTLVSDRGPRGIIQQIFGLRISPYDGTLWAASNGDRENGLFQYRMPTGKLIRKYTIPESHVYPSHTFTDLVIAPGGDVFAVDASTGTVYWVSRVTKHLEVFNRSLHIPAAYAIAISEESRPKLYVAGYGEGIMVVDIESQSCHPIAHPSELCLAGITGLNYFRGDLVAIQSNGMVPRVVRFRLTLDGGSINSFEILERRNPSFNVPHTGVVVDDAFYFVANPQFDAMSDGKILPDSHLDPVKILRLDLGR